MMKKGFFLIKSNQDVRINHVIMTPSTDDLDENDSHLKLINNENNVV